MPRLVHIPPIDHLNTIYIALKSSWARKTGDRSKSRHFGQASQTRMTCQWTTADHNDYGLSHSLASNERYLKIYINITNPGKITKGSKWPWSYRRRGAKRYCVHQHTKAALNRPQTKGIGCISRIDDSYALYIVLKRPKAKKIRDRCKPRHFDQASRTGVTCATTTPDHTDYGLTNTLDPNKRYQTLRLIL